MFGGHTLVAFVKLDGLLVSVAEGFNGRHRIVLVGVGAWVAQRLHPEPRKDGGVSLAAALGGGDHHAIGLLQGGHGSSAGGSGVDDELLFGFDAIQQCGDFDAR